MSCPHCATRDPLRGVELLDGEPDEGLCVRCGQLLATTPEQPQLEDADQPEPVGEVDPPPLPGFVTTEEELGENPRLTTDGGLDDVTACRRCRADITALEGQGYCASCGSMVGPPQRVEPDEVPSLLRLACGVPNPQGRSLCLACGERL